VYVEPLQTQGAKPAARTAQLFRQLKELLGQMERPDRDRVTAHQVEASQLEAGARELKSKADAIESAVYDLKAVNPTARSDEDTRTPEALIAFIEAKGREVMQALAVLKGEQ